MKSALEEKTGNQFFAATMLLFPPSLFLEMFGRKRRSEEGAGGKNSFSSDAAVKTRMAEC